MKRLSSPMARPAAVIFDMDGVLLDTEPLYTEATRQIVGGYGKEFGWDHKAQMMGRASIEAARYLVEALELPLTAEEYLARRTPLLLEKFAHCVEIPGAQAFTERLARRGVPLAVATSTHRELFRLKTAHHAAWFATFRVVVVGDDPRIARPKPAPDIFLLAAAELGVAPDQCLVFEDSPAGALAAHRAGMRVIALPDPALDEGHYPHAEAIVRSYADIDDSQWGW